MKISQYNVDSSPTVSDKLIGTEVSSSNETKNYTIGSIASVCASVFQFTPVLVAQSTVTQAPSALDTPLQVTFGAAQGTSGDAVMISSGGLITFNETGLYLINGYGSVERQGSSGGTAILLFRFLVNGTQAGSVKAFHLDTPNLSTPYEITFPINITTAGTTASFQIMRDSSGTNAGGLYPHTNLGGWSNVPSAEVNIWQLQ
ncbi:MAG: hypothetical protein EBR30_12320 [Cytophagia bacterium]|jgi:hypothetical protein|nr:hypothetical protein [Cytophagia bacterium]